MTNSDLSTALTRYLDEQQVPYRLLPHQTPATTIEDAAKQRGIRPAQMVKCILLRDMSDRYVLACAPGDRSVDPKKVRALMDYRRMTCVDSSQIYAITGYQLGTVTPLLLKKPCRLSSTMHFKRSRWSPSAVETIWQDWLYR